MPAPSLLLWGTEKYIHTTIRYKNPRISAGTTKLLFLLVKFEAFIILDDEG